MLLIAPSSEPIVAGLSLPYIVEYLTQVDEVFELSFPEHPITLDTRAELSLAQYGIALRRYCEPVLRGDFTWWGDACKYFIKKVQDDYYSLTGLEISDDIFKPLNLYLQKIQGCMVFVAEWFGRKSEMFLLRGYARIKQPPAGSNVV